MKLSVVMPVYNTDENYLKEAVESILNQTFKDFEFIIINDGSTNENIEKIILSYHDERIKYVKQENMGIAKTLNKGFRLAQGEYVARMDSDDASFPDRFEKQIEFLDSHPDYSVCGAWSKELRADRHRIICYTVEPKVLDFLKTCCVCHPTVMVRIDDFRRYNLEYNPDFKCEDYELWSRAIQRLKFHNMQEPLLLYRIHGDNLSLKSTDGGRDILKVRENIINYLTSDEKLKQKLIKKYATRDLFWRRIFSVHNLNGKKLLTILGIDIPLFDLYGKKK